MFGYEWIFYVISLYISIFLLLILIKTVFKKKISNIEQTATATTSGVGLIVSIVTICLACAVPILGFFGFLFDFPPVIVALMMGAGIYVIADLIIKWIEKTSNSFFMHIFIINMILMASGTTGLYFMYGKQEPVEISNGIHIHADLKVYVDEHELILYTPENIEIDKYIHFHNGENQNDVIHIHNKNSITLKDFFDTLNFDIYKACDNKYFFYVINSHPSNRLISEYIIKDLDKLFVSCSVNSPSREQINSVGNFACKQSKKC